MRLTAHFARFDCCDVQYWAEGGEEHVERALEVGFLELFGEVLDVEGLVGLGLLGGVGHGGGRRLCDCCGGHCWREWEVGRCGAEWVIGGMPVWLRE